MKTLWIIFSLWAGITVAFAQGKVRIGNGAVTNDSLITFTNDPSALLPPDFAFAGHPVPNDLNLLPSRTQLVLGLYAGSSSSNLALQTPVIAVNTNGGGYFDGLVRPVNAILNLPGGQLAYMQVKVWNGIYSNYEAQVAAVGYDDYLATGPLFTMTPGYTITYPAIWNGGGSTWQDTPIWLATTPKPPTITRQPTSQTAVVGEAAYFSLSAAGARPLSYQWYFGTNTISDATNSTLFLTNLHLWQSGQYFASVSNYLGITNSQVVDLSVLADVVGIDVVPRVAIQGEIGLTYRLDYVNAFGPTNEWQTVTTLTVTNQPQYYYDDSAIRQPTRFYRLVQIP